LKRRSGPTSVFPCLDTHIHHVLVGSIENKSFSIPVSFPIDLQESPKIVETKALIDSGAGGKFIDQNFSKALGLKQKRLKKALSVKNVDGTPNKKGRIRYKVQIPLKVGN